jgi:hypothetical protein
MKRVLLILTLVFAVGVLISAGCVQNPQTPATPTPTPTPTAVPTTQPAPTTQPTTAGLGTPGPTQVLPPNYSMDFQVQSNGNTANPIMMVSVRGGNGLNLDSQVDVSLTMPDGSVQSQSMYAPFYVGQNVTFPCSVYNNRVEIWVTAPQVGKIKVYDDIVPFQSINPGP